MPQAIEFPKNPRAQALIKAPTNRLCSVRGCCEPAFGDLSWCFKHRATAETGEHHAKEQGKIKPVAHDLDSHRQFCMVTALFAKHGVILRNMHEWRMVEPSIGHIAGLPRSQGRLVATNGIDCFIETWTGFYIGPDLACWEKDAQGEQEKQGGRTVATPSKKPAWQELYQ